MYGNKNTDFFLFSNTNDKWSAAFFQSNDKPEELANAHNGFGHGNNEGKNIDDQKHCKTLSRVSMDSNESSRKKKTHRIAISVHKGAYIKYVGRGGRRVFTNFLKNIS